MIDQTDADKRRRDVLPFHHPFAHKGGRLYPAAPYSSQHLKTALLGLARSLGATGDKKQRQLAALFWQMLPMRRMSVETALDYLNLVMLEKAEQHFERPLSLADLRVVIMQQNIEPIVVFSQESGATLHPTVLPHSLHVTPQENPIEMPIQPLMPLTLSQILSGGLVRSYHQFSSVTA